MNFAKLGALAGVVIFMIFGLVPTLLYGGEAGAMLSATVLGVLVGTIVQVLLDPPSLS